MVAMSVRPQRRLSISTGSTRHVFTLTAIHLATRQAATMNDFELNEKRPRRSKRYAIVVIALVRRYAMLPLDSLLCPSSSFQPDQGTFSGERPISRAKLTKDVPASYVCRWRRETTPRMERLATTQKPRSFRTGSNQCISGHPSLKKTLNRVCVVIPTGWNTGLYSSATISGYVGFSSGCLLKPFPGSLSRHSFGVLPS